MTIDETFSGANKIFIPFITCGYPDIDTTINNVIECVKNGAEIIELGIPFSDPVAEGPVIQNASVKALKNGTTTNKIFEMVKILRGKYKIEIPLIFMTYANVIFSYGTEKFMYECNKIGIDGIILPDVPFEERGEFLPACKKYNIKLISMIAPSSDNRIIKIAREAEGFIYLVSSLGVTGVRNKINTDLGKIIKIIRENTNIPCAVGFGISTAEQAQNISKIADGVIIGSAIIKIIEQHGKNSPEYVGEYVHEIKNAITQK